MSKAARVKRRRMSHHSVSELFSVDGYLKKDKLFTFKDKHIGAFLIMHPLPGSNYTSKTSLINFFKESFPSETCLQWSLVSSPDLENMMWGYNDIRRNRAKREDREYGICYGGVCQGRGHFRY